MVTAGRPPAFLIPQKVQVSEAGVRLNGSRSVPETRNTKHGTRNAEPQTFQTFQTFQTLQTFQTPQTFQTSETELPPSFVPPV